MLVNCNSCQKKFEVPDSAVTESGRLLQCGSCGNKWTQYPTKMKPAENVKKVAPTNIEKKLTNLNKPAAPLKKKKRKVNLYSEEYLKKKHGLEINGNSNDKKIKNKKNQIYFGFYGYLVTISVFVITLVAILNLTKEIIIMNYPFTENYINYLFEVFDFIKIIISNLTSLY